MKKNYFLTGILALTFALISNAGEVKSDLAGQVAKNFFWEYAAGHAGIAYNNINTFLIYTEYSDNEEIYYVFNMNLGDGFVIVSADDVTIPVLGYNNRGTYKLSDHPPALDYLLDLYVDQIVFARQQSVRASSQTQALWNALLKKNPNPEPTRGIGPLMSVTWNQDCYYNVQCPVDATGPC
nr:Spi family protease inhibitor [Bacteroidota bacterium]